MGDLN